MVSRPYNWADDPGALDPGAEVPDWLVDFLTEAMQNPVEFLQSRGLLDDYRAWLAAR